MRELSEAQRVAWEAVVLADKRLKAAVWMRDHNVDRVDGLSHTNAIGRLCDLRAAAWDKWSEVCDQAPLYGLPQRCCS